MQKILILGGGLSGLSAGKELSKAGFKVTILERHNILGGLAKSFFYKNKWIPITYHHVLTPDKMTQKTIKEYNLDHFLLWKDVKMGFWHNGNNYPLSSPLDFLKFKPLNLFEKIRFIGLAAYSLIKSNWKNKEGKNAQKWIDTMVGKSIRKKIFSPLAEIKFGKLSNIDAAYLGARLHEAAKTGSKHAYLTCGFQKLIEKIAKDIENYNGKIYTNAQVKKIKENEVIVNIKGKNISLKTDKIINTLPLPIFANLCEDLSPNLKKKVSSIEYQPMVCAVGGSKHRLTKTYWNIFIEPKLSFGGLFDHTILYKDGGINGERLYYMFSYVKKEDKLFNMDEKQIKEIYLNDLKKLNPNFEFTWFKAFKLQHSEPKFKIHYENLPIKLTKNIYLAGVYKEYPQTRTMHTALLSGYKTAQIIIKEKNS